MKKMPEMLLDYKVLSEWAFVCTTVLILLLSFAIIVKRSGFHYKAGSQHSSSLRTVISSYRVSVVVVTCLCILVVDFKSTLDAMPRLKLMALMDLGVGSFVVHGKRIGISELDDSASICKSASNPGFWSAHFHNRCRLSGIVGLYWRVWCSLELLFHTCGCFYPDIHHKHPCQLLWNTWFTNSYRVSDDLGTWVK